MDIVSAAPSRSTTARALVECATRAWKLKYPTSKNDDCTAVCLFLDQKPVFISPTTLKNEQNPNIDRDITTQERNTNQPSLEHLSTIKECIVTVHDNDPIKEELLDNSIKGSKKNLADCISTYEDEEWSALGGVTRVNSLLSIPRFFSVGKKSVCPRKPTAHV